MQFRGRNGTLPAKSLDPENEDVLIPPWTVVHKLPQARSESGHAAIVIRARNAL